jgi:hypothetical protein
MFQRCEILPESSQLKDRLMDDVNFYEDARKANVMVRVSFGAP